MAAAPIIVFDCGYLFFYRYHATVKNLRLRKVELTPEVVKESFLDHLDKQILKTIKKFKAGAVYFAMDVSRKDIWRTELFPGYKGERPDVPDDVPDMTNEILALYKKHGVVLAHKHLEADDVIYMVAKLVDAPLRIITNDKDILQVLKADPASREGPLRDHIEVYDGGLKRIEGDPYVELWTKVLCGDKSDNIGRLLTKKKALAAMESGELEEYKKTLNYKLINMDMIPAKYQKEFTKTWNNCGKLRTTGSGI